MSLADALCGYCVYNKVAQLLRSYYEKSMYGWIGCFFVFGIMA